MEPTELIDSSEVNATPSEKWNRIFHLIQIGILGYMTWLLWEFITSTLVSKQPLLPNFAQELSFERSTVQLFFLCIAMIVGLIFKLFRLPIIGSILLIAGSMIVILKGNFG